MVQRIIKKHQQMRHLSQKYPHLPQNCSLLLYKFINAIMKQQGKPSLNNQQPISLQPQSYFKYKCNKFVRYITKSQKELNDTTAQLSSNASQKYSNSIREVENQTNHFLEMLDSYQRCIIKKRPEDAIQMIASIVCSAEEELQYTLLQRRYYRSMISHFERKNEKMRHINSIY